jgi:hypothetical protein
VDGGLIVLHTVGHVRAQHKGTMLAAGQLDQAKIPVTDFRSETVTIGVKDRIKLRKLFQDAGLKPKPDEEATDAQKFVQVMTDLAGDAGGSAPLPECPATATLDGLRVMSGNELLSGILKEHDELRKELDAWQELKKLAEARTPAWETVGALAFAGGSRGTPGRGRRHPRRTAVA